MSVRSRTDKEGFLTGYDRYRINIFHKSLVRSRTKDLKSVSIKAEDA